MRARAMGAALAMLPAVAVLAWAAATNPFFLDGPLSFALLVLLPCAALGALLRRPGAWGGARLLLAVEGLVFLGAALRPHLVGRVDARLLIFGVDGATWDVARGLELPTFDALQAQGAHGVLKSREPTFSPLLWTTLASGKVPEEHGVHGFRVRSDYCRAGRIWDVAADAGLTVGVYKWLVTWPPSELPGFMVPAWLAPSPETWPAELSFIKELELSRRLRRKQAHARADWQLILAGVPQGLRWTSLRDAARLTLRGRLEDDPSGQRWRQLLLRTRMDRDIFTRQLLRHRPALATFTTYAPDALGHTHWGQMVDGGPEADAVPSTYRQADALLAELLDRVSPDTAVLVVSDHGFRSPDAGDAGRHFAPRTERLQERLVAEVGPVEVARVGQKLTVTLLGDDPEAERATLLAWLERFTRNNSDEAFFTWSEVPDGPRSVGLTLAHERLEDDDTVGGEPISAYVAPGEKYTGEHSLDGILLARGPGIAAGTDLGTVQLLDVAPTALALLGLPAADDMPGRVVLGTELPRVPSYDHLAPELPAEGAAPEVNEEQLKALGYIE